MSTIILFLTPTSGSFPFQSKTLTILPGTKILLGSTEGTVNGARSSVRVPSMTNGWFAPRQTEDYSMPAVSPLPLSSLHAELWADGNKVYIRDLDSAFGTYVNGMRIRKNSTLKTGDTISLGSRIPRNEKTPAYITDLHLSPVIMKVTLSLS